jgi:hypothetical protein
VIVKPTPYILVGLLIVNGTLHSCIQLHAMCLEFYQLGFLPILFCAVLLTCNYTQMDLHLLQINEVEGNDAI